MLTINDKGREGRAVSKGRVVRGYKSRESRERERGASRDKVERVERW